MHDWASVLRKIILLFEKCDQAGAEKYDRERLMSKEYLVTGRECAQEAGLLLCLRLLLMSRLDQRNPINRL